MTDNIKVHAGKVWINEFFPFGGESMWAEPLDEGRARIANVPFFTNGLAFNDIVAVDAEGEIQFVSKEGGLVPLVVLASKGEGMLERVSRAIEAVFPDGHYEGGFDFIFSMSVEPDDVKPIEKLLKLLKARGLVRGWEQTR